MTTERIQIVVTSAGAKAVRKDIEGLGAGAEKAARGALGLGAAIAGIVAGVAVRETVRLADSYTSMGNRIRTVTKSASEFASVQSELFQIAQRTRSPLDAITEGYSRLAISTQRMGLSQKETMAFTESLSQAVQIGGASAQEGASAMRQLGQALGTGALKSDEFNSVMENAPIIMETIAKGMGREVGDLKTLAGQGKITSRVIVDAFAEAREELAVRFGGAVTTVSSAVGGNLMNAITNLVGKVDEATGATGGLAEAIVGMAEDIERSTPAVVLLTQELTDLSHIRGPVDFFDDMLGGVTKMQVASSVLVAFKEGLTALSNIPSLGFDRAFEEARGRYQKFSAALMTLGEAKLGERHGLPFDMIADSESGFGPLRPEAPKSKPLGDGKSSKGATFDSVLRDLEREHELLEMTNDERKIAQSLDQARSQVQGGLSRQQLAELEYQLRENQLLQVANDTIEQRLKDEIELMALEAERTQSQADRMAESMNRAAAAGQLGNAPDRSFTGTSARMGEEQLASMRTFGEEMAAIFGPGGTLEQGFRNIGGNMADIIGYSIAFGLSWEDTAEAVKRLGQSIVAEVISSLIRIPIQLAINEAIASGLRAKATAETVAQAATTTAAMAPAAAATSLATAGTNSVGATAAIVGVSALAAGALIGAAMFKEGGYTGNGSRDGVAGLVHGREFVVNASATARHRGQLEAMNAGRGGGGGVQVTIVNQAGGVDFETRQIDDRHIEIIAKRIVQETAPDIIASDLRSPQSKTGRAISQTTTASRRRA